MSPRPAGWLDCCPPAVRGVAAPFGGLAGTIFVAFTGAVVLLFMLRVIRRAQWGP
ncbi:MAG: hypothetical protein ACRENP_15430 [Longimicrobiales bacterium]